MSTGHIIIVIVGALSGGFVSGLAGFGTGLVAMGIWLHALPPAVAAALVVICSVVSQLQTIPTVWHAIRPRRVLPFVIPGLIGVPIGTQLLGLLDPSAFRVSMGVLLLGFSTFCLICGPGLKIPWGGRIADGIVGLAGGVLGGLAGLSGPLPTMWAAIRGWGKDERRSLFQTFNLTILLAALLSYALTGHLTAEVGWAASAALPGTLAGAWLGSRVYRRLADRHFHNVILGLLAFSGLTLLWASR
jgi:uncharacterized membrane protein YfcA